MKVELTMTKKCPKCNEIKFISEFGKDRQNKNNKRIYCKKCSNEYSSIYQRENKIKRRKYEHEWRIKNIKKVREHKKIYSRQWRKFHPEKIKKYNEKVRLKVLTHYGGLPPKCVCCGELFNEFLSIDHINGGGNKQRKGLKINSGQAFYRWLIKNDYPEGFRVLCMNCNFSLGKRGYCPHTLLLEVRK